MKSPQDMSQRQAHIGNLCMQWAYLEYMLSHSIWAFIEVSEETGMLVTGVLDIKSLCVSAHNLAKHRSADPVLVELLLEIKKTIQDDLLPRRNMYVHGIQFADRDGTHKVKMLRGKDKNQLNQVDYKDIKLVADKVHDLGQRLHSSLKAQGLLKSWPF